MARRRSPQVVVSESAKDAVSGKLAAGPVVEVWLSPAERPPLQRGLDLHVAGTVRDRFCTARRRWAETHGVPESEALRRFPSRRVRFADPDFERIAFGPWDE